MQSSGIIYIHIISCLVMALEQKIRFVLDLSLAESYIYGTATIITSNISYSINIQQATQQLIVLPTDVFYNEPADRALISFGRLSEKSKNSNNNTRKSYLLCCIYNNFANEYEYYSHYNFCYLWIYV